MIDIHSHILPGFDDGPDSLDESIEMAKVAVDDGIKVIIATPHSCNGLYSSPPDKILKGVEQFNQTLKKEEIPLVVLPGSDVHITTELLEDIRGGRVMTVNNNNRYVMVELPSSGLPQNIPDFIWELKLSGITPIFSHPERNEVIQEDVNILYEFIVHGALSQITAMSLTGEFGTKALRCALSLLKYNLVHVIASDSHSVRSRPPLLSEALDIVRKVKGNDYAIEMVTRIPEKIIAGEELVIPEPIKKKYRTFVWYHRIA